MFWHLGAILLGIGAGFLLFAHLPRVIRRGADTKSPLPVSVIIPARDEQRSLGLLLGDLRRQSTGPQEVIVVDDQSTDRTAAIAGQYGATLVRVTQKPLGWTGKTYACQLGAKKAAGGVLLFLDADVRLAPHALARLYAQYTSCGTAITVQPWHTPGSWVEQLALVFNLIAGCTLANRLPFARTPGLYGPVLMIDSHIYQKAGGHAAVKGSVVEDLDLGLQLDKGQIPYSRFLGDGEIAFRMYPGGLGELFQGFVKNFSLGASKTSPVTLVLIILWVTALCRVPIELALLFGAFSPGRLGLYLALYLVLVVQLLWAAGRVGRFSPMAVVLYPAALVFFVLVFLVSLYKKLFHRPITWKGRKIRHGESE